MSGIFKSVKIPNYQIKEGSFVVYKVEITTQNTTWTVWRRFRDFIKIHEAISENYNVPELPPKRMFGKTSRILSETRRQALEEYVQILLLENDNSVAENPDVIDFFELKGKLQSRKSTRAMRWVEECEDAQVMTNEITANLSERRKHVEQGIDAGRITVEIRSKIRNLESKIEDLSEILDIIEKTGSSEITDGELLRRQNMLQTLRGKLEELQRREKEDPANHMSQRNALLNDGKPSGSGRVWGKETSETQNLENKDLISFQRDVIKKQDEGLDKLGEIIGRQKNIAHEIGNELEAQNRLLDRLDNKMDETNIRLGTTTKRVMKVLHS